MPVIAMEAQSFKAARARETIFARASAAFFLATGIDLPAAMGAEGKDKVAIRKRVQRLLERERLRGGARHWSYDLNRHIALKQALAFIDAGFPKAPDEVPSEGVKANGHSSHRRGRRALLASGPVASR